MRRPTGKKDAVRNRIRFICFLFFAFFLVLAAKAVHLQYFRSEKLEAYAHKIHRSLDKLTHKRGLIYDRNGVELAVSLEVDSVYAEPSKIEDVDAAAKALSEVLHLPFKDVARRLSTGKHFAWIKRQISHKESKALRVRRLKAVGFVKESKRFYPHRALASNLLGLVGIDCVGLEGLEHRFDTFLKGEPGCLIGEKDALNRVFFPEGVRFTGSKRGSNLILTIDSKIQFIVERELDRLVAACKPRGAVAVAMVPDTGEVLAMASRPTFDPNAAGRYPDQNRRNRAVSDVFEPGSTFKVFTMAAVLEERLIGEDHRIYCEKGAWRYGGRVIHDTHPYQWLTLPEIIKVSSNIGASKLADMLGRKTLYGYIDAFGFGRYSGIRCPGEFPGLLRKPGTWSRVGLATHAFGQGLAVTPIQLASAFCAVVNGGNLMRPFVVREIRDEGGEVVDSRSPRIVRRVISREASRRAREILAGVVEKGGTGTQAALKGFRVAGKTGTAQKVDPETRRYSPTERVASFIGCVPAEDPMVAVLVLVDEPQGEQWQKYGGVVAAPAFRNIVEDMLKQLGVFPGDGIRMAKLNRAAAAVRIMSKPKSDHATGSGYSQMLQRLVMPDLRGMSIRQVLRVADERSLEVEIVGSGCAVSQSPPPGRILREKRKAKIVFAPAS